MADRQRKPVRAVTTTDQLLLDIRDGQDEILAELRKMNGKSIAGVQEPVSQPSTRPRQETGTARKAPAKKTAAKKTAKKSE